MKTTTRRAAAFLLLILPGACASPEEDRPGGDVEIEINGTDQIRERDLLDAAAEEFRSFREHRRAADLDDAAWAMQRRLLADGHGHGSVGLRLEPSKEEIRRAVFEVEEGPQTWLGEIRFTGNEAFPGERLDRFFRFPMEEAGREEEEEWLFVQSKVDSAVRHVEGFYLTNGYRDVVVGPIDVAWSKEDTWAEVTVPVREGRRFTVAGIEVEGRLGTVSAEAVSERVGRFRGGPFSGRTPTEAAGAVLGLLYSKGHLLARVDSEAAVDEESTTAGIVLTVEAGPVHRISEVVVSGNERTKTWFILSEAGLKPGEILTQEGQDRAVQSLHLTGLFTDVELRREPVGASTEDVSVTRVEIVVSEVEARTIDVEAGWGSYETLRGAVRYRDRNLFGIGRDFEVEPFASLRGYGIDTRLIDAYLLGRDDVIVLSGGYEFREQPSFESDIFRAEASVRHRFDSRTLLTGGYRFRSSDASDVAAGVTGVDDGDHEASLTSGPFLALDLDHRDGVLIPTGGWRVRAGLAWSTELLGADLDYLEATLSGSLYEEIAKGLVLAVGVNAATREILDGRPTLPIQERFFLGGEDSVRSFYEAELGPTDFDDDPIGGLTSLDAHAELRIRVFGDFHVAPFYDLGTVGGDSFDVTGRYGHAIGLGLRYHLPIGPIRLDFGFNPGRTFASDQDWALHFSFGFSF